MQKLIHYIKYKIIAAGIFWVFASTMINYAHSEEGRPRYKADDVQMLTIDGQPVLKLIGHVQIKQGTAQLRCHQAVMYNTERKIDLAGNVVIEDGDKVLQADSVVHYEKLRMQEARGHVKIIDSLRTLTADLVTYWEETDVAFADRNVKIIDEDQRIILTGGHAEYFRNDDSVLVTFNPVLIQHDSLWHEELRVTGNVMELAQQGQVAVVTDSVSIFKDSTEARCGIAEYLRNQDKIILRTNPRVWQEGQQLKGDSVELYFDEQQLNEVKVIGKAQILSRADSIDTTERWNKLSGQTMTILINENQMEKIIVENQSTSWYHIIENQKYKGMNKVMGDKITIFLADSKIKRIRIESNPGMSTGSFYPAGKPIPESELIVKTK